MMMDETLNATVRQSIRISPELIVLRIVPDDAQSRRFLPGQFAVLRLPPDAPRDPSSDVESAKEKPKRLIKRAYSIASANDAEVDLEFYISIVRSGELTPRLFLLAAGDRLWLGPKIAGVFTIDRVPGDAHLVLIGTGTGLAPYMSMLRSTPVGDGSRGIVVIHGARHSWDLGYHGELVMLAKTCPNFTYLPAITRANEEHVPWGGRTGRVQEVWAARRNGAPFPFEAEPHNTHVFLCGNPAMIESMERLLADDGFAPFDRAGQGQVHAEKYW